MWTSTGPEMKSTGEVLGIGKCLESCIRASAPPATPCKDGGVLVTVRDADKAETPDVVKKFASMGFGIFATEGTAQILRGAGIGAETVTDIPALLDGAISGTSSPLPPGRAPSRDSVRIRRRALKLGIPALPPSIPPTPWQAAS